MGQGWMPAPERRASSCGGREQIHALPCTAQLPAAIDHAIHRFTPHVVVPLVASDAQEAVGALLGAVGARGAGAVVRLRGWQKAQNGGQQLMPAAGDKAAGAVGQMEIRQGRPLRGTVAANPKPAAARMLSKAGDLLWSHLELPAPGGRRLRQQRRRDGEQQQGAGGAHDGWWLGSKAGCG